ncbi:hypothetical protein ACP70R_019128 [Stipagrostis hirtigluma subsp. patula]
MVIALLREMKDRVAPAPKGNVLQDLEHAMRTKGGMSREEEAKLRILGLLPHAGFVVASGLSSFMGWFGLGIGTKLAGLPPVHGLTRFGLCAGFAYVIGKMTYYSTLRACPAVILNIEDDRMKMELANIILTKHSNDKFLVQAVRRHFFSEHLFDDLHQDRPLFRWHPRRSYIDTAFMERMKEIEANNSGDEASSISRQTTVNIRSFGDLMEDPLACILGSPGDMESSNPPENTGTVLKRSQLRARRRSYRHHHRHADKFAGL